ncbi:MAG: hypothetical protein OEW37_04490 [Rhodospirillaceae bacterium]|nr:hypothetical protein [Rhodospirillaceae bacterium]
MAPELKMAFKPAKALRITSALGLVVALSGCLALPPAIQFASLALDGFSYMSTGKSVSDHAISAFTNKDCAMHRALDDVNGVCINGAMPDLDISVASGEVDINMVRKQQMKQTSEIWLTSNLESSQEM